MVVNWRRSLRGAEDLEFPKKISARQLALRLPVVLMAYLGPADCDVHYQTGYVGGVTGPLLRRRRRQEPRWLVHYRQVLLGVAVALVAAAALLHLPTVGRPMAAILRPGHNSLGKPEVAAVVEAARSAVPLDGQTRDPIDKVVEGGRLLGNAEVAQGGMVPGVAQAVAGHGAYCGRGYPSARREAAEHRLRAQRGELHLEVQHPHEEHQLALPFQPRAMERFPVQGGG